MEKPKRVVGYARVSTEAQDITRQIEMIKDCCKVRNYTLIKIIQEKISGAQRDRKSINDLLEVDRTIADMIIVSELSRLSREDDIMRVLSTINDLLQQGVDILFLDKPDRIYEAGTSLDLISIITLAVEARASADERYKIAGRMQTGLRTKLTEFSNMYTGGTVPFGYKVIPNPDYKLNVTPKNLLVVDEGEARAVKYLFQQLVDGNTIRKTVRVYNDLFPYKLTYAAIWNIIRNPKYKGEIYRRGKRYGTVPEFQIISPEDFDKANRQVQENDIFQSHAPKHPNPLKGLLFCACGCSMYIKPNKGSYMIYRCASCYNDKVRCGNFGVKNTYVLSSVWECVRGTLHTEEYRRFSTQRANELQEQNRQIRETITQRVNAVDEMKTESASIMEKMKRLTNLDLIADFEQDYNKLSGHIKQVEREIADLNGRIAENDIEIQKSLEQKDFSTMERSALYKEKLQKVVWRSVSAMRGILEIWFKNGMTQYIIIKKHRKGGAFLVHDPFEIDAKQKCVFIKSIKPEVQTTADDETVYKIGAVTHRLTYDEFFNAYDNIEELRIPITDE